MVVQDNKRCFSTESVPKCAEGARAQETVEKKVCNFFISNRLKKIYNMLLVILTNFFFLIVGFPLPSQQEYLG
jgi:hypothetical protein